jgi:hypothetical protein
MDGIRPDKYLSGIRFDNAGNNFNERGFSRSVLAKERVHTASPYIEGNIGQCPGNTVRLAYPGDTERG